MVALPAGFRSYVTNIGIKDSSDDFTVVAADDVVAAAGVFTQSRFAGPSVIVSRRHVADHRARAVVVISKNANVATGAEGLANALEVELHARGIHTYILDGDNVRQGLNRDLGFTDTDRVENIRRIAEVAKLMMDAGLIVMTSFISPFRGERDLARELIGPENFVEIFVDTPLEVCEQRDVKGLYKKAREGKIPNMTGVNSPYEAPLAPDVTVRTQETPLAESVRALRKLLESAD